LKKRLLKPPEHDGEVLFLPPAREMMSSLKPQTRVWVAHQPYFFNPGVSLKYLFLDYLRGVKKRFLFLDTDHVSAVARIPSKEGARFVTLARHGSILSEYPAPPREILNAFISNVMLALKTLSRDVQEIVMPHFLKFREVVHENRARKLLKEVLAFSFLQFYQLPYEPRFVSELTGEDDYGEFVRTIYTQDRCFRDLFNDVLDEYRREFRFRYKNFPFPKLEEDEIPFWVVRDGTRTRFFKTEVGEADLDKITVVPRAVTLTLYLRLYKCDVFIHGVGGANYEWVQDRMIERFFNREPTPYSVVSGTFLIDGLKEREHPYFLYDPRKIHERMRHAIEDSGAEPVSAARK
jgi:hypothetical protein